jgi:hypothetical protein
MLGFDVVMFGIISAWNSPAYADYYALKHWIYTLQTLYNTWYPLAKVSTGSSGIPVVVLHRIAQRAFRLGPLLK